LEFQLQYGDFSEKAGRKSAGIWLKNKEKAELSDGKPRSAITKIQYFSMESKLC